MLAGVFLLALLTSAATAQPASLLPSMFDDKPIVLPLTSPRASKNKGLTLVFCPCSATGRGHPRLDDPDVKIFIRLLEEWPKHKPGLKRSPVTLKLERAAEKIRQRYGLEGYINLEAVLRPRKNLVLQCNYDTVSGRTLVPRGKGKSSEFASAKPCDKSLPEFFAKPSALAAFVPSPAPAPPAPQVTPAPTAIPPGSSPILGLVISESAEPSPEELEATPAPPVTVPTFSSPSEAPEPTPVPPVTLTPFPSPSSSPTLLNEGCVAVEHLRGATVQHASPLLRQTLCSRGFCATPNHGLIVDGIWTSMKQLCAGSWACTEETRLVNNLKISSATRLRFGDSIVITPYDARFPIAFPWIIQIAEDILALVSAGLMVGVACALMVLLYSVSEPLPVSGSATSTSEAERTSTGPRWAMCSIEAERPSMLHRRLNVVC